MKIKTSATFESKAIKNRLFSQTLIALLAILLGSPSFAADTLCSNNQYVVGFFNGIWNTRVDAFRATRQLRDVAVRETNIDPTIIQYETFYNHTGSQAGATAFQDLAEVFMQRAEEIDPVYSDNFFLFWSTINGDSDGFFETALSVIQNTPGATADLMSGLLSDLYTDMSTEAVALISDVLSDPPTEADYQRHSTRIKTLALEGNKLMLAAHSQGNLFVNNAYQAALTIENYTAESIGVLHIAPASPITNGPHVLANIDLVINGLRTFGSNTVPPVTVDIPASHLLVDPSGHTLIDTYLNPTLPSYADVVSKFSSELTRLQTPDAEASQGSFTVTLTWDGEGDVDLHTYEPSGSHVYYIQQTGVTGFLDVDNTFARGPEHYYASCDDSVLETGTYGIGINNYARATGRTATIQVSTPFVADLITKTLSVGPVRGSGGNNPDAILEVIVSRDEAGQVSIQAN